jgi:putative membrane protein insertion efficiency factor
VTPLAQIVALPVRAYRLLLSPWVGHGCRYQPTCSAYALEALDRHGALKGGWLAAARICRCQPWGGHGYDPVPGADPAHDLSRQSPGPAVPPCEPRRDCDDKPAG